MKRLFIPVLCALIIFSCSKENDIDPELEVDIEKDLLFSVEDHINMHLTDSTSVKMYYAETEDISFEFKIIDGNGDYTITSQENCKATIDSNIVRVELLNEYSFLTITDKYNKSESIRIKSRNKMFFYSSSCTIILGLEQKQSTIDWIDFGVGGYTTDKLSGRSAEIEVDDNDILHITALRGGTSYFDIVDERGMRCPLCVIVTITYNVGTHYIKMSNDQTVNVKFKHDEEWRIDDGRQEYDAKIFEHLVMHKASKYDDEHDSLQISTTKEQIEIVGTIRLVNKNGSKVYIGINT